MVLETLTIHDGNLALKVADTASDRAEFIIRYYPMFPCTENAARFNGFPLGAKMVRTGYGDGVYTPAEGDCRRSFGLEHGGQTMSTVPEFKPIPQPKCSKPVRWYYGRYQKLLKTGWRDLPLDWSLC